MKKILIFGICLFFLATLSFTACSQMNDPSKSDITSPASVMTLLPKTVQGIIMMDVHRVMMTKFADKAIHEKDNYPKYQKFISETGIDPQKDIYWIGVALAGLPEKKDLESAAVISMTCDKERVLAEIRKQQAGMGEITYQGVTIHTGIKARRDKVFSVAFLDEARAVYGDESMVKAVINVFQKKEDNVLKNKTLSPLIQEANQDAMVWSAITVSPDAMKKAASQTAMMNHFQGINAVTMFLDYHNKMLDSKIRLLGGDPVKNKQLADILTGLKALGAGAAAKNPDIGEFLNRIDILAGPDFVTITAGFPQDLIQRLSSSVSKKDTNL